MRQFPLLLLLALPASAAPDGAKLYADLCARCHGDKGQGVAKKYKQPLAGELSVPQLAELVRKTMPEDKPESLSKDDAAAIAAHMHTAFYGKAVAVRADAARLTAGQFRHAVADAVGSFRPGTNAWADGGKGLKGEYFGNRGHGNRVLERTDGVVSFDFGTKPPTDGKYDENEFSARWTGSVLAPDTGEYTVTVKSDQAVNLWVNGDQVVNATVKSGAQTEYPAAVTLTGGRVYPVRLDFSKALQGVKDKKPKPVPAFVRLEWKRPGGAAEVVPARFLSPAGVPEQAAVATPFPPDDKSQGWERGTAVSKEWDAAVTDAALEAAEYVVRHHERLAGVNGKLPADVRGQQVRAFAAKFVERAFRRPLTPEQKELYVNKQFDAAKGDVELGLKRVVLLAVKSPRFVLREPAAGGDGYDTAARLSFALWDSIPDDALLNAARDGKLKTKDEVRAQAERMLSDPRAQAKLRGFLLHWLRLDTDRDLAKDAKLYPGFDTAAAADLRTSLELFLDDVLGSKEADFRRLLTADEVYLNGRLAKLYGADLPADAPFTRVKLDGRAGVLTHPYLLSAFAYTDATSPIHRGVFIAKGLLGTGLKPPPEAFSPVAASLHPDLTTRERVALQTKPANCATCHSVINPLGFTLEGFDAIGRVRKADNNKGVDTAGGYLGRDGKAVTFAGPVELAKFVADSPEAHAAFAEAMFHHLVRQPVRAYGPARGEELRDSFKKAGYNVRALAADIAAGAAMK